MAKLDSILASMVDVAKAAAPFLVPGGAEAVALGTALAKTIDKAIARAEGPVPPALIAEREAIELRIRAHVADTAANLRG
jgi:hypothetical protein